MVHIGYFIDDICLPPADLTVTFHGISFYGFCMGGGGALKRIQPPVFFSVDWDTKYKFLIF